MNSSKYPRKTLLVSKSGLEFGSFQETIFEATKPRSRDDRLPAMFNKSADALTPLRGTNSRAFRKHVAAVGRARHRGSTHVEAPGFPNPWWLRSTILGSGIR